MRHGNVYPQERARIALDRFFTESNLTALRELSLRFVAGRVDAQLEGIAGPVPTRTVSDRSWSSSTARRDAPGTPAGGGDRRDPAGAAPGRRHRHARRRGLPAEQGRRMREYLDDATDLVPRSSGSRRRTSWRDRGCGAWAPRHAPGHAPSTGRRAARSRPHPTLTERILERLPALEITIVADARESTDPYRLGRGD